MNPEYLAMVRSTPALSDSLYHSAGKAAELFFSRQLIPESLCKKASKDPESINEVISCLTNRVQYSPEELVVIVEVLLKITGSEWVVQVLKQNYTDCNGTRRLPSPVATVTPAPKNGISPPPNETNGSIPPKPKPCRWSIYLVLLAIVGVAGMYLYYWRIDAIALHVTGCHTISKEDSHVLENYLSAITGEPMKICKRLKLEVGTCNQRKDLTPFYLAERYLEEKAKPCWEDIVSMLCKDFKQRSLAKTVADEHGVKFSLCCNNGDL